MTMDRIKKAQAGTQAESTNTKGKRKDNAKIQKFYFQKLDEFLEELPGVPAWEIIGIFDLLFNLQYMRTTKAGGVQWII